MSDTNPHAAGENAATPLLAVLRTKVDLDPRVDPVKWGIWKPRLARLLVFMAGGWADYSGGSEGVRE